MTLLVLPVGCQMTVSQHNFLILDSGFVFVFLVRFFHQSLYISVFERQTKYRV